MNRKPNDPILLSEATKRQLKWQITTERWKYTIENKDYNRFAMQYHKRYLERKKKQNEENNQTLIRVKEKKQ